MLPNENFETNNLNLTHYLFGPKNGEYYTHSGRYCFGKTPMATFLESLPLAKEKILHENFTEEKIQIL